MVWEEISSKFIMGENLVQSILVSFTNICDEASCEFSIVNAIELVVEE